MRHDKHGTKVWQEGMKMEARGSVMHAYFPQAYQFVYCWPAYGIHFGHSELICLITQM